MARYPTVSKQAAGGTYPTDPTKWEFMAIATDYEPDHGVNGYECYSTSVFGGPKHSTSWVHTKPICGPPCPLLLDTAGQGFHLTSAEDGVRSENDPPIRRFNC